MTFDQAQAEFQRILRGITAATPPEELLEAQRQLDTLTDQLRGREGFESLRASIDEVYDNLVGTISHDVLAELKLRDEIYTRASEKFASINTKAKQSAKTLNLERTKMVLPALNESVNEIQGIVAALKNRNPEDAVARSQSLLALIEKVKEEVSRA